MLALHRCSCYHESMNQLPFQTRLDILPRLCEDSSRRATARVKDVSFHTVKKRLIEAGRAWALLHEATVRHVKASKIQCEERWAFG